jgi:transcriptional regulator with XRE-family HTH domain
MLSQKALAEILGVSDAAVTMMEKGKRLPSFEILCQLADYFNVSIDYLVGRSDDPTIHK